MLEKLLKALGEVGLGIGPDLIPPIIQVIMADHHIFIVMVITKVCIDLTSSNFLRIPMVE